MTFSKPELAVVCVWILSATLAWQWYACRATEVEARRLERALKDREAALTSLQQDSERLHLDWLRADAEGLGLRVGLASLLDRHRAGAGPGIPWDPRSGLIRIPKEMGMQLPLTTLRWHTGQRSVAMREALQLSEKESAAIEAALQRFDGAASLSRTWACAEGSTDRCKESPSPTSKERKDQTQSREDGFVFAAWLSAVLTSRVPNSIQLAGRMPALRKEVDQYTPSTMFFSIAPNGRTSPTPSQAYGGRGARRMASSRSRKRGMKNSLVRVVSSTRPNSP